MNTLLRPIGLHCGRTLRDWSRTPAVIANGFAMPIIMLLIVLLIFGHTIEAISPTEPIARLVPLMVCSGVMFAAIASATALVTERDSGLLERFATLPNPPLAPLLGRICAEGLRGTASAILVLIIGTALGFRSGPLGYIGIVVFALLFAVALGTITTWIGTTAKTPESVIALSPLLMLLMFFNTGFVPLDGFPDAVQPLVRLNPLSAMAEAMIALGTDTVTWGNLAAAVGWCAGLAVIGLTFLARIRRD